MTVSISSTLTQRNYSWTDWKDVYESKLFSYQYDNTGGMYTIWGYDGPEVSICQIWIDEMPDNTTATAKEQNNLDRIDFETNFKSNGNAVIDKPEQQLNTIYQTNISNFFSPTSNPANFYLAISLLNTDGYYHHPPNKSKLRIYAINSLAAKTNTSDIWTIGIGIIVSIDSMSATMTFLNTGSIYLSNVGVSNSVLVNLDYPLSINCTTFNGRLTNVSGGVTFPNIPGIGSAVPIINAAGVTVFPQIGDIIMSVSCISDITGFTPANPAGMCAFQSHIHYTVED